MFGIDTKFIDVAVYRNASGKTLFVEKGSKDETRLRQVLTPEETIPAVILTMSGKSSTIPLINLTTKGAEILSFLDPRELEQLKALAQK